VRIILNIIWLVLSGFWLSILYVLAAVLLAITIIGIPFAKQSLKLAGFILWPFGRTLIPAESRNKGISVVGNVLWVAGLRSLHGPGCPQRDSNPFGVANFKFAGAALAPFGKEIVNKRDLRVVAEGAAISVPD
jgi:uncharacterized membrane protein YccF (DUF307 family)